MSILGLEAHPALLEYLICGAVRPFDYLMWMLASPVAQNGKRRVCLGSMLSTQHKPWADAVDR